MVHAGIFFSLSQKSTVQSHNSKITTKAALSSTMGNHQNQIFVYSSPTTHTLTCKIRIMHRRIGNSIPNFRIQEHIVRHTHTNSDTVQHRNKVFYLSLLPHIENHAGLGPEPYHTREEWSRPKKETTTRTHK